MSKEQGQRLGLDMGNNFMLMMIFSLPADEADDPNLFRSDVKKALTDLIDDYTLAGIDPKTARMARDTAKQLIGSVLQNVPESRLKPQ
jgi:hypothetical protein